MGKTQAGVGAGARRLVPAPTPQGKTAEPVRCRGACIRCRGADKKTLQAEGSAESRNRLGSRIRPRRIETKSCGADKKRRGAEAKHLGPIKAPQRRHHPIQIDRTQGGRFDPPSLRFVLIIVPTGWDKLPPARRPPCGRSRVGFAFSRIGAGRPRSRPDKEEEPAGPAAAREAGLSAPSGEFPFGVLPFWPGEEQGKPSGPAGADLPASGKDGR